MPITPVIRETMAGGSKVQVAPKQLKIKFKSSGWHMAGGVEIRDAAHCRGSGFGKHGGR